MIETVRFIDQSGAKPGAMDLVPAIGIPKKKGVDSTPRSSAWQSGRVRSRRPALDHRAPARRAGKRPCHRNPCWSLDSCGAGRATVPYRAVTRTQVTFGIRGRGLRSWLQALRSEVYSISGIRPSMALSGTATNSKDIHARLTLLARCAARIDEHPYWRQPPPIEPGGSALGEQARRTKGDVSRPTTIKLRMTRAQISCLTRF